MSSATVPPAPNSHGRPLKPGASDGNQLQRKRRLPIVGKGQSVRRQCARKSHPRNSSPSQPTWNPPQGNSPQLHKPSTPPSAPVGISSDDQSKKLQSSSLSTPRARPLHAQGPQASNGTDSDDPCASSLEVVSLTEIIESTFSGLAGADWSLWSAPSLYGSGLNGMDSPRADANSTDQEMLAEGGSIFGRKAGLLKPGSVEEDDYTFRLYSAAESSLYGADRLQQPCKQLKGVLGRKGVRSNTKGRPGTRSSVPSLPVPSWQRDPHALRLPSTCHIQQLAAKRPRWVTKEKGRGKCEELAGLSSELVEDLREQYEDFHEHRLFLRQHNLVPSRSGHGVGQWDGMCSRMFADEKDLIKRLHRAHEPSESLMLALADILGRPVAVIAECWLECQERSRGYLSALWGLRMNDNLVQSCSVPPSHKQEAIALKSALVVALKSEIKLYGEHHPNVERTRTRLAYTLYSMGDRKNAREQLERIVNAQNKSIVKGNGKGSTKRKKGGERNGESLQKALPHIGAIGGLGNSARMMLSNILAESGEFQESIEHLQNALQAEIKNYGHDHPAVGIIYANLGAASFRLGNKEVGRSNLEAALKVFSTGLGEDHLYSRLTSQFLASLEEDIIPPATKFGLANIAISMEKKVNDSDEGQKKEAKTQQKHDNEDTKMDVDDLEARIRAKVDKVVGMCRLASKAIRWNPLERFPECNTHDWCEHLRKVLEEERLARINLAERTRRKKSHNKGKVGKVSNFGADLCHPTTAPFGFSPDSSSNDIKGSRSESTNGEKQRIDVDNDRAFSAKSASLPTINPRKSTSKGNVMQGAGYRFYWINEVNDETLPSNYLPQSKSIFHPSVKLDSNFLYGCACEGSCKHSGPNACPCRKDSTHCYTRTKRLQSGEPGQVISECNETCACNAGKVECTNRLVQLTDVSPNVELQVFKTEEKGWGLRTLKDIPKFHYVCEYVGEVVTEEIAQQRGELYDLKGCSYLWTQGEFIPSQPTLMPYTIDATDFGNVGRFINHSCESNLLAVSVRVETRDSRVPRIGIFTSRDVAANEELTIDYNYYIDPHLPENLKIPCKCGKPTCRGRLR
mmetsp:Transcript_28452/g.69363  ORF Transcript_28452/g.69363 Transcript_28452/m.69363 type:complete len:1081 (+) Transcript_28452:80-3322(+)